MMKNMTYTFHLLSVALLLTLPSCSTDSNEPSVSEIPMSFSCTTAPTTRATTAFTGSDFGVVATQYTSTGTKVDIYMDNVKVTNTGGSCSTDGTYYWPTEDNLHFAAYSPYTHDGMTITTPATSYAGYQFSGTVNGTDDLMFADELYGNRENNFPYGSVPMNFNHALTQVRFEAVLTDATDTKTLQITSLKLKNVRHQGSATFTHLSDEQHNVWNIANMIWNPGTFDETYEYDVTVGTNYYLMPQTLYAKADDNDHQQVEVTYCIVTNGTPGGTVTTTVPLKQDNIDKWTVNQSLVYTLNMTSTREVELNVAVQPWELEAFENEFSSTVSVNNDGKIRWTEGTYNKIDGDIVVLKDAITSPAEFKFTIASPLGGTWKAFFVTQSGNPNAFTLTPSEGPVGKECTVTVAATEVNQSNTANQAELRFVVIQAGQILPVDILTTLGDNHNYKILQNINK